MRSRALVILLALGIAGAQRAMAQTPPATPDSAAVTPVVPTTPATTTAPPPAETEPDTESTPNERIYYGSSVTLSFGSAMTIGFYPWIGYKLTPKLSGGVEAGYEYVDYGEESTHNYGGSVFGRYRIGESLYAHGEYQAVNYEIFTGPNTSERDWVPFLLVGGGAVRMLTPRTYAYVEVLFDVLQDDRSPYGEWEPIVNVGVGVGF